MPQIPSYSRRPFFSRGFTLVELLTVIAVIGILAGILVPVIGSVKRSAKKQQSVQLFLKISTAFEDYKTQYQRYPIFKELDAKDFPWPSNKTEIDYTFLLNGDDNKALLRQVLTADNAYLTAANAPGGTNYNRLGIRFLTVDDNMVSALPPGSTTDPLIVDGFGNSQIAMIVHTGGNREIDKSAFTLSVADAEGSEGNLTPVVVRNVPQKICIYSLIQNINGDPMNSPWNTNWDYSDYNQ